MLKYLLRSKKSSHNSLNKVATKHELGALPLHSLKRKSVVKATTSLYFK